MWNNILVVGLNWLGDAVMSLPAVSSLRDSLPHSRLSVFARNGVIDVYRRTNLFDECIEYTPMKSQLRTLIASSKVLAKYNFDSAVIFPRSFRAVMQTYLSAIPARIGYRFFPNELFLTHGINRTSSLLSVHRVEYYTKLLSSVGIDAIPTPPQISVNPEQAQGLYASIPGGAFKNGEPVIGVIPGAEYGEAKRWLAERYAETIHRLVTGHNAKVIIWGSPAERLLCERIASMSNAGDALINMAGLTKISELPDYFSLCTLFISNDTGSMHLAAAVGKPVIAIFGSTDTLTTSPCGEGHVILQKKTECAPCLERVCRKNEHLCMNAITVDDVLTAVSKKLGEIYV